MRLLFKQRMFSWFDSYDIYDEDGYTYFTVKGRPSWGHRLEIFDDRNNYVAMIKEEIFTFLPRFAMFIGDQYVGDIKKEFTLFKPVFTLNCNGWQVNGDLFSWDYRVTAPNGQHIMSASKQLFNWTDTYTIDVVDPANAILSTMIVLAIDAAKCSQGDS